MSDPVQLTEPQYAILRVVWARGEASVPEIWRALFPERGLAQSTVSGHLACLRDCRLVTARAEGRASLYSLARPELLDLLVAAERLLAATGDAVELCPTCAAEPAR